MLTETLTKLRELLEASKKRTFTTEEEESLKEYLMEILINENGEYGPYRHPKYAERLQKLIIRIVPAEPPKGSKEAWVPTAAISFDEGIIYINRGFLVDESRLYQLNVLIRHELAHNLLMHQVRMMKKLGDKKYAKMSMSSLLHDLFNIIADFEISNRKYTEDDKKVVLNMFLNGRLIGGLVTEMHRRDWMKMTMEEMYEALLEELNAIRDSMKFYAEHGFHKSSMERKIRDKDMITLTGFNVINQYSDKTSDSIIWLPIEEYFKKSKVFKNKFSPSFQAFFIQVYTILKELPSSLQEKLFNEITESQPFNEVDISAYGIAEEEFDAIYTPEEKFIFVQVLKALLGIAKDRPTSKVVKAEHSEEYRKGYNEIIKKVGKKGAISDEDLVAVCAALGIGLA